MSGMLRRSSGLCRGLFLLIAIAPSLFLSPPAFAAEPSDIESNLSITIGGAEKQLSLAEAMAALNEHRAHLSGPHRVCPRLWRRRYAGHVVPGGVAVEIRRCCRRDAPGR